jgi:hypothetical protein
MLVLNLIIHHKLNTSYNRAQYKLQYRTKQGTIEHNTSYNRAQYKLLLSTVQVTVEHNTGYSGAQYKLQKSKVQVTIEQIQVIVKHNTS